MRVLIAGGGVAALEAALALRALAEERVQIDLLTRAVRFVYRPLQVLEPFDPDAVVRLSWSEIAASLRLGRIVDDLGLIEPDAGLVRTAGGRSIRYDALIVAVGAIPRQAVSGAVTVGEPGSAYAIGKLIGRLRAGAAPGITFACPPGTSWTIAIYELALLTAQLAADAGVHSELAVLTAESEPLEVLGSEASKLARELLDRHGIELRTECVALSFEDGRLAIEPDGELPAEAVVALPRLEGPAVPGILSTPSGFLRVDEHGLVVGEEAIYGAGDVTDFPVKQGGLAAQQADALASHIAERAGANVQPVTFNPVLRSTLLTGGGSRFLRRDLEESGARTEIAEEPIWWPPAKIAGHYLAPFLAARVG
jgi:sulfide:quinone oxidoreductase